MATTRINRAEKRFRRHHRVRARITGTAARPRVAVFRSTKHISAQLIDDIAQQTIAAASDSNVKAKPAKGESKAMAQARAVGTELAKRAKEKGIEQVVFDRGGFAFHGRVKALADAAREGGLVF